MALPASPPIDLLQAYTEFGAPLGTPLTSFLRGGAYVPNTPANAGVPTALPISLLDLLGASAAPAAAVAISNQSVSALRFGAGNVSATYNLSSTGNANRVVDPGGSTPISGEWLVAGSASAFEVQANWSGQFGPGSFTGDSTGVWLNLGTSRSWTVTQTAATGSTGGNLTVQIRPAGGGAVLDTAVIGISAERS